MDIKPVSAVDIVTSSRAFSRWGDGEWNAVLDLRKGRANTDGHQYFDDMREALRAVLRKPQRYDMGMQGLARRIMGDQIEAWLEKNGASFEWVRADTFHDAAMRGDWAFKDAFTAESHAVVGPVHLRPVFPNARFVEVPTKNCWLDYNNLLKLAGRSVGKVKRIGFCAGMMSKVMIDDMFGGDVQLLDFGAVFDPLGGVKSRGYMRQ